MVIRESADMFEWVDMVDIVDSVDRADWEDCEESQKKKKKKKKKKKTGVAQKKSMSEEKEPHARARIASNAPHTAAQPC